jgi:hypothetical protein
MKKNFGNKCNRIISGIYSFDTNPYYRWGIKTGVSIGERIENKIIVHTFIKFITKTNECFYFGGYGRDGNVIFTDFRNAIPAGLKERNKLYKKIKSDFKSIMLFKASKINN